MESLMSNVPDIRIRKVNEKGVNPEGDFVLYWMIANRRIHWNFSLQRAVSWTRKLEKPLVILEALRSGYPWASDRLHRFIMDGMAGNARQAKRYRNVIYYPYIEPEHGKGKGLLTALAKRACVLITDDFPAYFIPRMVSSASRKVPVALETVDSNCLLPMRAADRVFPSAYAFRRFLQKTLPSHLYELPEERPLKGSRLICPESLPRDIMRRWPPATIQSLKRGGMDFATLPIDHRVAAVDQAGGSSVAERVMRDFIQNRLHDYPEKRNQPEEEGTSGLSPYLHFGHLSVHQIFHELTAQEGWFFDRLSEKATGKRSGWWGMSEAAEAFLDELVTWRELGFNMCWQSPDYDDYDSLPDWALATLKAHELDERSSIYSLSEFEKGHTHDPLWNAAQIQLVREGRIHNYLRMLWGKKVLEWSPTHKRALEIMIELNNKYALDGRDPNSFSGIFWVLGRYDRPWGPERPIFGKVRYMSSRNTARKVRVQNYIKTYAP
jgi:deoxyribodipyrimidine photo-lyase